jgi:DNA-binding transcriptional LysR family regulator
MLSTNHQVFLEVATHLSFSKAARVLYISQPAISRHISLLERSYNCALFERRGNGINLTDIGQKIYGYLLKAKDIQERIDYEVSVLRTEHDAVGKLKLGASTIVTLYSSEGTFQFP